MSSTIDDLATNEIPLVCAAKNIAPYLHVTLPKAPPGWEVIIPREIVEQIKENEQEDAEFKSHLKTLGIVTEQEGYAYKIVRDIGSAMERLINQGHVFNPGVEVLQERYGYAEEVRITKKLFDDYLQRSVKDGIFCLEDRYWIAIEGVEKPQIVNPEFEIKAVNWLKEQVHSILSNYGNCEFLETITVKQETPDKLVLIERNINYKSLFCID